MDPISTSALQKDLLTYLDKAITDNEILNVSTPNGSVVIMNAEAYKSQLAEIEEIELTEVLRAAADDIANGRVFSHEEVFSTLQLKINAQKATFE